MRFQITGAGFAAALAASNQGPLIRIARFRVGSGSGYTPTASALDLSGTVLYTGTPIGYQILDQNTCEFTLRIDESQGTWQFGEIALDLLDGTMFAVGTLQRPQWKVAYPDADFNRYNVKIRLTLNGAIPRIEFVVQNITAGVVQELPSIDALPPVASSESNIYLCHSTDEVGNETLATRGAQRWTLSNYLKRAGSGSVVAAASGRLGITVTGLPGSLPNNPGQYAIQFVTGAARGTVRRVVSSSGNALQWATPELNAAPGDLFELLTGGGVGAGGGDDGFFYSLIGR